jgi:hypothetical protein
MSKRLLEAEIAYLRRIAERGAQMEIHQAADMIKLLDSHDEVTKQLDSALACIAAMGKA